MKPDSFRVIYEDNHLLVVDKPAGLPTMGVSADKPSLITEAKSYIKEAYNKPGNVYLGIVSRLDAPVTGVVVIARTSKAASRLTNQFRSGSVEKKYHAVVAGAVSPQSTKLVDFLRKSERHRKVLISQANVSDAKQAVLSFQVLNRMNELTLLEVELETGRKHQIRVQLSNFGHPIIGDRKYGSTRPFTQGIALHSRSIRFSHPVSKEELYFKAPHPPQWPKNWLTDRGNAC